MNSFIPSFNLCFVFCRSCSHHSLIYLYCYLCRSFFCLLFHHYFPCVFFVVCVVFPFVLFLCCKLCSGRALRDFTSFYLSLSSLLVVAAHVRNTSLSKRMYQGDSLCHGFLCLSSLIVSCSCLCYPWSCFCL